MTRQDPASPQPTVEGAARMVVGFARAVRQAGLAVPVGSVTVFADALDRVGVERPEAVYWAGRATLVRRPEDIPAYDVAFDTFWHHRATNPPEVARPARVQAIALDDGAGEAGGDGAPSATLRWSAAETLRERDFADYDADDWAAFERLVARLGVRAESRRSRRRRADRRRSGHPDLRRTVRAALRTDGEPLRRSWRTPTERPRRLVLLVDVSGSMEPYARALLRFAHAAVVARGAAGTEVFTLGTRLTRVTRELATRDPDAGLGAVAAAVADWSGGTRLGAGLRSFNERWGVKGVARGAVVVVLSDGWDRGDPADMADAMGRLARVAHRVVWANPLKASPGYEPLARGMAAALPYVDVFVEGHSLGALEHLADVVGGSRSEQGVDA